jgi:hypothetical protein
VDFSLSAEQRELTEAAAAFARREPLECAGLAVTGVVISDVKATVTGPTSKAARRTARQKRSLAH